MYYLKVNTGTMELHKETRREIAAIKGQFDAFLKANGMTAEYETGTVEDTFDKAGNKVGHVVRTD